MCALRALAMAGIVLMTRRHCSAFMNRPDFARQRYPQMNRHISSDMKANKATFYHIAACPDKKWVNISFSNAENTTCAFDAKTAFEQQQQAISTKTSSIPDSVLQYERQLRKIQALDRASKTNITVNDHLHVLHVDEHLVVVNKPSGILCVPGVKKYRSLLDLVYETYGGGNDEEETNKTDCEDVSSHLPMDSMIVHRLDMDTSGVVVFARTRLGMSKLHEAFRERIGTKKMYEALLVGWLDINEWIAAATSDTETSEKDIPATELGGGAINLPLQRDHKHPPFMRVSTPESETEAQQAVKDLNHAGWKKIVAKKPKPSITQFRILSHELWNGYPVTRVGLNPITGRTHQLRVHCAALGHPILGDPAYGYCGEAHPNGGFTDDTIAKISPTCTNMELRRDVDVCVKESGRTMCLNAKTLCFNHPATGEHVCFEAESSF